jgi:hypothetical protein
MKANKTLIFKVVRILIYIALIIGPSIVLLQSKYISSIVFFSISLMTGIVGIFIEVYKK